MASPEKLRPLVHIVSDGTAQSTRVVGPDGALLPVRSIELSASVSDGFEVQITLTSAHIDVSGEVTLVILHCPLCSRDIVDHRCQGR